MTSESASAQQRTPLRDLLARLRSSESGDLKMCLSADLTSFLISKIIYRRQGFQCTIEDLENLLARFSLTIEMAEPTSGQFNPDLARRSGLRGVEAAIAQAQSFSQLPLDQEEQSDGQ